MISITICALLTIAACVITYAVTRILVTIDAEEPKHRPLQRRTIWDQPRQPRSKPQWRNGENYEEYGA